MKYPLIAKLVMEKGADKVAIPRHIERQALNEAGALLLKQHRYIEASKCFFRAKNEEQLVAVGEWLLVQLKYKEAAYFFMHTPETEKIEVCAMECMNAGDYKEAIWLFSITKNEHMVSFIRENFQVNI